MSVERRTKTWYLLRNDPELEALEVEMDLIDAAIYDEHYLRFLRTKKTLERIAPDLAARLKPPPRPHRSELHSAGHIGRDDDLEELITAAKESPLDRLAREHLADEEPVPEPAPLIRRYYKTELHVR